MRISGFTLIRNGVRFDYPFIESMRSLLPLVDELIVNVGISDADDTLKRIRSLAEQPETVGKIRIFESRWPLDDPQKKKEGRILSEQTNLSLERCSGDWCLYLQADEVIHEEDLPVLRASIQKADSLDGVEGLLFDYVHFYGSYDVIQQTRSSYRREVRAFRNGLGVQSVGDAQSFRKPGGEKLQVIRSGARVFHYGWVRPPEAMKEKTFFMDQLYHGEPAPRDAQSGTPHTGDNYRYKKFWGLKRFEGSHPSVMLQRISQRGWAWDLEHSPFVWKWGDLKRVFLDTFERLTGIRLFEYRSYRLIQSK